jgi:hypothetical protein
MRSFRRDAKIGGIVLAALLLAAQAFRIEKTNPPVLSDIQAHPSVKSVLKQSCYDCHSNETVWPWYANVAPMSWLVANDVNGGRKHLNFSEWGSYDSGDQEKLLKEILEEVGEGEMPLWYYSLAHPESKLGPDDLNRLKAWVSAAVEGGDQVPQIP